MPRLTLVIGLMQQRYESRIMIESHKTKLQLWLKMWFCRCPQYCKFSTYSTSNEYGRKQLTWWHDHLMKNYTCHGISIWLGSRCSCLCGRKQYKPIAYCPKQDVIIHILAWYTFVLEIALKNNDYSSCGFAPTTSMKILFCICLLCGETFKASLVV